MAFLRKWLLERSAFTLAWCVAAALITNHATAQPIDFDKPIVACYLAEAVIVGTLKCADPPSTLVGTVFGRCDKEEQTIRAKILNDKTSGYDRQNVADIAIHHIHERMASLIQSWIFQAQVGAPDCTGKKPSTPPK
jgi:hypothetical protein